MSDSPVYQKTSIWKRTLASQLEDANEAARTRLRDEFLRARDKVGQLVSFIRVQHPELTVHDLSHLDALWETADVAAGAEYEINPLEAFILGFAILLHDSAMPLAAFPGGLEELKKTTQWKDCVGTAIRRDSGQAPTQQQLDEPPTEVIQTALPEVLRILHAEQASKLPSIRWSVGGIDYFLIENVDLRLAYGDLIGRIAASHWWNVEDIQSQLPTQVNAMPNMPKGWKINPVKAACLLRVADATHIDSRRAPGFSMALVQPKDVSHDHWAFQTRLQPPICAEGWLCFTGSPFPASAARAWWLCYETISSADREIRMSNDALEKSGAQRMACQGIKGANSPTDLARLIPTDNWMPVDAGLKVSDIPTLVKVLGGKALYGDDPRIPLRELIQNAADAVRARQCLSNNEHQGCVEVRLLQEGPDWILEVRDDGVGMSAKVMTGVLIDFGRSLWRSRDVSQEFPGLQATSFQSVGQYGIGFFAVFMIASSVIVKSRRVDGASEDTSILEFVEGTEMRPLFRKATKDERMLSAGTQVRARLKSAPYVDRGLLHLNVYTRDADGRQIPEINSLKRIVSRLCPALDVTVKTGFKSEPVEVAVTANDWLDMPPKELLNRLSLSERRWFYPFGADQAAERMELLRNSDGTVVGRASLLTDAYSDIGCTTIGGFHSELHFGSKIAGVFCGAASLASRNRGKLLVEKSELSRWASSQAKRLPEAKPSEWWKPAASVLAFGGDPCALPVAKWKDKLFSLQDVIEAFKPLDTVDCIPSSLLMYNQATDTSVSPEKYWTMFKEVSSVVIFGAEHGFSYAAPEKYSFDDVIKTQNIGSTFAAITRAIETAWGQLPTRMEEDEIVGHVDGKPVWRAIWRFKRC